MSLFGNGRREGLLALLLLVVLAAAHHAGGLLFGRPRNPASQDVVELHRDEPIATNTTVLLPAWRRVGELVAAGELPLWNDDARFGEPMPFSGAALLYPPYWLLALVPTLGTLEVLMFLHTVLAGVLMYRLLRRLLCSRYAAFLGAATFQGGWFLTVALDRLPDAAACAWLPLVLEATWACAFAQRRRRCAVVLGVAAAAMITAGSAAVAFLGGLLAFALLLFALVLIDRADRGATLATFGKGVTLAALLTAPMLLHLLQYAGSALPPLEGRLPGLTPRGLLAAAFAPGLFGELGTVPPPALSTVNPGSEPSELAVYPGALAAFVAVLAVLRPKRTPHGLFWLLAAGIGILLAVDGPWADLLVRADAVPSPGAALGIAHVCVTVLVAKAVENFFDAPQARRLAAPLASALALATAIGLAAALWLLPEPNPLLGWLVPDASGVTLEWIRAHATLPLIAVASVATTFVVWRRVGILRFKTALACAAVGECLLLSWVGVPRGALPDDRALLAEALPLGGGRAITYGNAVLPRGEELHGREGARFVDTTGDAILVRTARYLDLLDPGVVHVARHARVDRLRRPERLDTRLAHTASLGKLVTATPLHVPGFVPALPVPLGESAGGLGVSCAIAERPRARLCFHGVAAGSPAEAADLLLELSAVDHVVVESPPPEFSPRRPTTEPRLEWLEDRPGRVRLRTDVGDGRAWLVLADAWAPGWQVLVDGTRERIRPADLAFRGVPLREGEHVVEFRYRPWAIVHGPWIAGLGVLLALLLLLPERASKAAAH